jgi:uncharacterized protein (DUF2267 family)
MHRATWRIKLGFGLAAATAFVLLVNLMVFGTPKETTFWVMHSLAMMPIEILVVTLILNQLLEGRARQEMLHKLNMVIGAFFSEVGSDLLRRITAFDADVEVRENFFVKDDWDDNSFAKAKAVAAAYDYTVDAACGDLAGLRDFLVSKRDFLLRLLENPNLLEHASFTNALWAVFHVAEELENRSNLSSLSATDLAHLSYDLKRAYAALAIEWLDYIRHLKLTYPYLYSLAVRLNPLDPNARAEM